MSLDIEALSRNQKKLISNVAILAAELDKAIKRIKDLEDKVVILNKYSRGLETEGLMEQILKAARNK